MGWRGPQVAPLRGLVQSFGREAACAELIPIARRPETPRTVYLGPSHFSLWSLSNTANLCFRKAGAGAAQHLPPNPTPRF